MENFLKVKHRSRNFTGIVKVKVFLEKELLPLQSPAKKIKMIINEEDLDSRSSTKV